MAALLAVIFSGRKKIKRCFWGLILRGGYLGHIREKGETASLKASGSTWDTSEGIWKHLGTSGGIWETSGGIWKTSRGIWETSGGMWEASAGVWVTSGASEAHPEACGSIWRLLEASGTHQEGSWSHLETFESHLGVIWEASGRHLEGKGQWQGSGRSLIEKV